MDNIKIKKAKIKDDLFLEVEYTEELPGHSKKDTKLSCTVPVHDDLKKNFQALHVHLALLCDEEKLPKGKTVEEVVFPKFHVRSISIGGSDENERVTVSGYKEGKYGDVNLSTPSVKYEDTDYPYSSELAEKINDCVYEVEQYLFHGKRAPERQLEMSFDEDPDGETLENA